MPEIPEGFMTWLRQRDADLLEAYEQLAAMKERMAATDDGGEEFALGEACSNMAEWIAEAETVDDKIRSAQEG